MDSEIELNSNCRPSDCLISPCSNSSILRRFKRIIGASAFTLIIGPKVFFR